MRRWTYKLMSDEMLMKAYAKGDSLAFEYLYQRNKSALFLFLRRQCENEAICEELAHDAWLAVIRQAENYVDSAKFKTWLFRIAHYRLVDHWRKHGGSSNVLFEELSDSAGAIIDAATDTASQGIELQQLLQNLAELSSVQTEALLLKIEGFSHAEIADITDCKKETVKSRLRYATQRLRVSMEAAS